MKSHDNISKIGVLSYHMNYSALMMDLPAEDTMGSIMASGFSLFS